MKTDFLVIGAGISGLTYSIKVAEKLPNKKIVILTKGNELDSNTQHAQGGIAVVKKKTDSYKKHVNDTLVAGDGLCDRNVVLNVIKEGPNCFAQLREWGMNFDLNNEGNPDLGIEGGHTENRVVHYKDITGAEIIRALLNKIKTLKNVRFLSHHFVVDLISNKHILRTNKQKGCYGAYVLDKNKNKVIAIKSNVVLMAAGGLGQVYMHTTNPEIATGDGIALAYRINAEINKMEFIQFHPTALYESNQNQSFLISEAIRGIGAKLLTKEGKRFLHKYDKRLELASRDIVARAIVSELQLNGDDFVYLDCTSINKEKLKRKFPNIVSNCRSRGIDVFHDLIPVVPTAHYVCGGIKVNEYGETNVRNLFASGEVSNTGLHGANRLASNSLLEAFVYADKCFQKSVSNIHQQNVYEVMKWKKRKKKIKKSLLVKYKKEIKNLMSKNAGIIRSDLQLDNTGDKLELLYNKIEEIYLNNTITQELGELRNMVLVSKLIISQSKKRKINCGVFYNQDLV